MRALQLQLHRLWDRLDDSLLVGHLSSGSALVARSCPSLLRGMSGSTLTRPRLLVRCGLGRDVVSVLWSPDKASVHFLPSVVHSTVTVFADNSTAMAYLRNARDTLSPALNTITQRILLWSELHHVRLASQFIMGRHNVLADSLSHPDQIQGSEWTRV